MTGTVLSPSDVYLVPIPEGLSVEDRAHTLRVRAVTHGYPMYAPKRSDYALESDESAQNGK